MKNHGLSDYPSIYHQYIPSELPVRFRLVPHLDQFFLNHHHASWKLVISLANPLKISRNHRNIPTDIAINQYSFSFKFIGFSCIFSWNKYLILGRRTFTSHMITEKSPCTPPTIPSLHYGIPQHCHHHQISPQHSINIPIKSPYISLNPHNILFNPLKSP